MDGQTPEHFLEVLFKAQDRATRETDEGRRGLWRRTIRDIEAILVDQPGEIAAAHTRLGARQDAEGRRMYAYVCGLMQTLDAADREAQAAIARARQRD